MKYSFVVPCFNVESYVGDCLKSIMAQTKSDWEAICVDDGSKDNTGAVLDGFADSDPRIKVIHQKNSGVGIARNVGIEKARGDWILFLDGDDVVAPWLLEICEKCIRTCNSAEMVRFSFLKFDEAGYIEWNKVLLGNDTCKIIDLSLVVNEDALRGPMWCRAYRKSSLGEVRYEPLAKGQDLLYMFECVVKSRGNMISCDVPCVGYRQRSTSTMHSPLTYLKVRAIIDAAVKQLRLILDSDKDFAAGVFRRILNNITEKFYEDHKQLNDVEKIRCRMEWVAALKSIARYSKIPIFQRIRLRMFVILPYNLVAKFLFGLPQWLKKRGFHR